MSGDSRPSAYSAPGPFRPALVRIPVATIGFRLQAAPEKPPSLW